MGEGRVLGIGRGYPLEDQETGILSSDYTGAHTPLVHILYADINDELPHRRITATNDRNGRGKTSRGSSDEYQRGHTLRSTSLAACHKYGRM